MSTTARISAVTHLHRLDVAALAVEQGDMEEGPVQGLPVLEVRVADGELQALRCSQGNTGAAQ